MIPVETKQDRTGVKGEKYPRKPDIFEAAYDPVSETENDPEEGLPLSLWSLLCDS